MEREFAQYQEPETVCDEDTTAEVMSPEEVFEEAFGELDQLDAAMLQLAPRKNENVDKIFIKYSSPQLRGTRRSVTAECLSPRWRSPPPPSPAGAAGGRSGGRRGPRRRRWRVWRGRRWCGRSGAWSWRTAWPGSGTRPTGSGRSSRRR